MTNPTAEGKPKLYQKILVVQRSLEPLEKSGKNTFHKYSYTTAGDVLLPVTRACNEQGLIVFADCIESYIEPGKATVRVRVTIADSETGEQVSITSPGYAEDYSYKDNKPTGDKAVYKALTGATKYAFRSLFCLPSEDDPERDARSNSKSSPATADRAPSHNQDVTNILKNGTTKEMQRLGWSSAQGRLYLQQTFNKSTRDELTESELQQFLKHLKAQPTPTATPSSV